MKEVTKRKSYSFCFRRWSRKPYASFLSVTKLKTFKIGVLSVGIALVSMSKQDVLAQVDSMEFGKTIVLEESLVIGRRADALPNMVRVVSLLSNGEIKEAPAQSLNDLLRYLQSVDIRQRGPVGVQADVSIRGGSFEQTQVLLNGVNFSDPQTGHYSLDLPVSLGMVSKIEVLQGLSAPGAIGGALNIVTETGIENEAAIYISGGQHEYLDLSGNASLGKKNFRSYLSASRQRSDGYTNNTDFDNTSAFAFLQYQNKSIGSFETQFGYQRKMYGSNGFYSFKYPDQFEAVRTFLGSLKWQKEINNIRLTAIAYHRQHFDRFELFRYEWADWYTGHNYHQALTTGGELNAQFATKIGLTTVAVELRNEHIYSNTLGYDMDDPRKVPFENDIYYTKHADRNTLRAFASQSLELGRFGITGGVSIHHSSDFDAKVCFALDSRFQLGNSTILYGAVNQSLRLPTFTDLFYTTATHNANPNLQPEKATTIELGTRYVKSSIKAGASVFYRMGRKTIDWMYIEGEDKSQSVNHAEVNVAGVELSGQWLPSFYNKNSFIQSIGLSYTYINIDKSGGVSGSSYTLDQLRHKVSLNIEHLLGLKNLKARWRLNLLDRMGNYVSASGSTEPYEVVFLANLRVQWQKNMFTIFAEAMNLFGETYFDYGGITQPKQWLSAGVVVRFK
ncbi:MAG: TonB-dependent receptor [Prevotellaceae bacterium]|jgi:iron complex outermembrane receptor protein|nr:TonB-dependent receptor [Prevotellaceae bacterium]